MSPYDQKAYMKNYRAEHREEARAYNRRYYTEHREECNARDRRRYARRREAEAAYRKTRRAGPKGEDIKAQEAKYRRTPRGRALRFLRQNKDCTSTVGEVTAIYAGSRNALTGEFGVVGYGNENLVLDHVHGGPAIGLVPSWLNLILERVNGDLPAVVQYLQKRGEIV